MSELTIYQRQGSVSCDFTGIQNQLAEHLKQYQGIVFTEDTKADAKKTVAEIRKDKADFESRLKEAKKEYMRPWEEFNTEAQRLVTMFDEPIIFINKQISDFEEKRKAEKKERIKAIYDEIVSEEEIRSFIPLERIYNEKWLNTTFTEKAIKDDISSSMLEVKTGLETINSFDTDAKDKALDLFKRTLILSDAIAYIGKYEEQKREILAKQAEKKVEAPAKKEAPSLPQEETFFNDKEVALTYTIFLKDTDRVKLDNFLKENSIEFFCHGGKR